MTTNNIPPTNELDIAYSNLYNAYMRRDRKAIESNCLNCHTLEIPNFHELANAEMTRIYAYCGIKTYPVYTSIEYLPLIVLNVYALACMNVLFNLNLQNIRRDCQFAYQTLTRSTQFQRTDILYAQQGKQLTVENLMKVVKYALALVDIIYPDNKLTSVANPTIWALQGIDDVLNNKSKTELTNHSLHIAADFLASNVKDSLKEKGAKRRVAISALMVNLAIDFLIKD